MEQTANITVEEHTDLEQTEELTGQSRYRDVRREPVETRSEEARKTAAYVLEVLGGRLGPQQAAEELGISVPRYYTLEERAIRGLAAACEPMPLGPLPKPEQEIGRLEKRCADLEKELLRYQALSRAAQRAIGLDMPEQKKQGGNGRRSRKPVVRALRASARLKGEAKKRKRKQAEENRTETQTKE